jgi:hypothetical protein
MYKEDNLRNLIDAIVQRRFIFGISQEGLASRSGVCASSIKNIERWDQTPDRKFRSTTLFAIEDGLGWERYTIARMAAGFDIFPSLSSNPSIQVTKTKPTDVGIVTMGMIQDMIEAYVTQRTAPMRVFANN